MENNKEVLVASFTTDKKLIERIAYFIEKMKLDGKDYAINYIENAVKSDIENYESLYELIDFLDSIGCDKEVVLKCLKENLNLRVAPLIPELFAFEELYDTFMENLKK